MTALPLAVMRAVPWGPCGSLRPHPFSERTDVDVRIGVTQAPREISVELADGTERETLRQQVEAALAGAVDVLWLTDRKGRSVAVPSAKIAYVEIGSDDAARRIGFGD